MGSSAEECFNLKWDSFQASVINCFTDLRNAEDFFDVTVAIDQEHQFPAHKVILSASSPYFREILKRNPAQHPVLVMPPNIRHEILMAMIDFIYQGEVKVPSSDFNDFMFLAEMLKMRGLTEESEKVDYGGGGRKAKVQPKVPGNAQMGRKRSAGPTQPPNAPNPQAKRTKGVMLPPTKYVGPPMPHGNQQLGVEGLDPEDVHEVEDEDSSDLYGEYDPQYEGQEYPMDAQPQGAFQPSGSAGPKLVGLRCPTCACVIKGGPEALVEHCTKVHGGFPSDPSANRQDPPGSEDKEKPFSCHICDKPFKAMKNVQAHMKRVHKIGISGEPTEEGALMDPRNMEHGPSPGKKKGRPKKSIVQQQQQQPQLPPDQQQHDQHQQQQQQQQAGNMSRPIGQVPPAPRTPHDAKEWHEQSRPPIQQDRGASPMMSRQRPPGMMSPPPSGSGGPPMKRPMAPQGIMGPGMRPRGPVPSQFQPGYPHQPMDIKKLGMKLGGAISITSSEQHHGPPQPSMRRPIPSTSRMHASSPKNDPLATPSVSRPPSIPQRQGSISQDPVEVKQEPMDDIYEEGEEEMPEDYDEENEGYGEEEEEEDDEQDFAQGSMDDMYGGEAPYDDEAEHDGAAYQQ